MGGRGVLLTLKLVRVFYADRRQLVRLYFSGLARADNEEYNATKI